MLGSTHTEETKKKMSDSHKGKSSKLLVEKDVVLIKIFLKCGLSLNELANVFKVSKSTISSIKHDRNWSHIVVY